MYNKGNINKITFKYYILIRYMQCLSRNVENKHNRNMPRNIDNKHKKI